MVMSLSGVGGIIEDLGDPNGFSDEGIANELAETQSAWKTGGVELLGSQHKLFGRRR